MGQTCAPTKIDDSEGSLRKDTDKKIAEEAQPTQKLTNIINTYQLENEKMKKELDEIKNKSEQETVARQEATQQNEKIMEELAKMRALIDAKDRELVKHRLEAALHSKATLMIPTESVVKLLKEGTLEKFTRYRKVKSAKEKWVQVEMHTCHKNTEKGFIQGHILLKYSDKKEDQLSTRCKIISVDGSGTDVADKYKDRNFLVQAIVGRENKEIVFACANEETKREWVDTINKGLLLTIEEMQKEMKKPVLLKVEFSKEKLGMRVEENILESKQENLVDEEKFGTGTKEKPCELIVKKIKDNDLYKTGLAPNCIIVAINDINIRGMPYETQVGYLTKTAKPFTLSFITGPDYLGKEVVQTSAYPGILAELLSKDDNAVKTAFDELIKGTPFEKDLNASDDKVTAIAELLSNQRRLRAMLQNVTVPHAEL